MRYGGHQTFFIREGWLHKGVDMLLNDPERFSDPYVADYLGVGRNMALAVKHWLFATGLAEKPEAGVKTKTANLKPTELAKYLWIHDKYFLQESTWWVLHVNMINNPAFASTWYWFFHDYLKDRFEKPVALEALKRWEHLQKGNSPSDSTLDRDLLVFLSTYSRSVPPTKKDPEEEIDCPLRDLGLMTHFKSSGTYQLHRKRRNIDPGVLLYVLNLDLPVEEKDVKSQWVDRKFSDLTKWPLSPTKVFVLSNEDYYETLMDAERKTGGQLVQCRGLAGDRQILFRRFTSVMEILPLVYENQLEAVV